MRIVAGRFGGRKLLLPSGKDIRPTSDKVRGAVFNALTSRGAVEGAVVLDLYCGTGALGLEALSRGAAHCTFVDVARASLRLAQDNALLFRAQDECDFICADAAMLPDRKANQAPVDLVFLDPPYERGLAQATLEHLPRTGWLAGGCILAAETEKPASLIIPAGYDRLDEKIYGDTKISFLRYSAQALSQPE